MNKYVDADALKERLSEWEKEYIRTNGGVVSLEILVDEMPAADVAPVRHEHWIPVKFADSQWLINDGVLCLTDGFLCGSCGYEAIEKFPYCPRCGARMDMEETQ